MKGVVIAAISAAMIIGLPGSAVAADNPELISVDNSGQAMTFASLGGQSSNDGTKVAFGNQTSDDFYAPSSIYLRNRVTHTTKAAYRTPTGYGAHFAYSGNGRYLAIRTFPLDGGDNYRLRVRDVVTGTAKYLSSGYGFTVISPPSISDGGTKVVFTGRRTSDPRSNVYLWDLSTSRLNRVTSGSAVTDAVISGNGARVAFRSNGHVYARWWKTGSTVLADARPDGMPGNATNATPVAFSTGGRYLLFSSSATDLATGTNACASPGLPSGCAFRKDLEGGLHVVSVLPDGTVTAVAGADLSSDARVAAFAAGTETREAFARRIATATTRMVSVDAGGTPASAATEPAVNGDGSAVTFTSPSGNFGYPDSPDTIDVLVWLAASGV